MRSCLVQWILITLCHCYISGAMLLLMPVIVVNLLTRGIQFVQVIHARGVQ